MQKIVIEKNWTGYMKKEILVQLQLYQAKVKYYLNLQECFLSQEIFVLKLFHYSDYLPHLPKSWR